MVTHADAEMTVVKGEVDTHRSLEAEARYTMQGHLGKHQGPGVERARAKNGLQPLLWFLWEGMEKA